MISIPLKILILEDSKADAEIIRRLLLKNASHTYEFLEVADRAEYVLALQRFNPDVILSDNSLPQFNAAEALQLLQENDMPIPFILVTGTVSEEFAAGIIKAGADDYLLKDRLARLPAAIDAALRLKQFQKEKAATEIKIRQNEKRFRSIIENNYDSVTLLDASFKTIYRSPSGYRLTGWTDEEIQHAEPEKLIHPDDIAQANADYMECLSCPGKPIKSLTRFLHKNKGYVWMEGIINNLLNDENVQAIVYNFRDVTERVEAEEESKENEEKFRSIVENITDILCTHDLDGNISFVNLAAKHNLGYEVGELLKMNIKDILLPESKEKFGEYFQYMLEHGTAGSLIHVQTKAGEHRIWKFRNSLKRNGTNPPVIQGFAKDVTEKIQAEEQLIRREKLFKALVENNESIISLIDENMVTVYRSASAVKVTGWTNKEFEAVQSRDYIHPEDVSGVERVMQSALENPATPQQVSFRVRHKNGHYIQLEGVIDNKLHDPLIGGLITNLRDVTERNRAKEKLLESENRFRALVENNDGIISLLDKNLKIVFRSSSAFRITGWTDNDFDKISLRALVHPEDQKIFDQNITNILSAPGVTVQVSFRIKHNLGHHVWLEGVMINLLNDPAIEGIVSNLNDVTERKLAENILKEERDKFAIITATAPGLICSFQLHPDGHLGLPYVSEHSINIWGFSKEEVLKNEDVVLQRWHQDDKEPHYHDILLSAKNLTPWRKEFRYNHPTKGLVWLLGNSMPVAQPDGSTVWHGIITDITERKDAEKKILKASRLYLFISQINQMIVRTTTETALFKEACKIAVECGRFKMAWIGLKDELSDKIIPVAQVGDEQEYLSTIKEISAGDIPQGRGPAGRAVREDRFIVCNDIENDPQMLLWRDAAINRGYSSSIGIPIRKLNKTVGVFNLYSGEKNFFDAEEIALLTEAATDVSFALDNFEKETARQKAEAAVAESEQRYQTLTETSPVGIFHTDAFGSTTYVNPCWCNMSGLSFEQALGSGWLSAVHPEDREQLKAGWNKEVLAHQQSQSEYRFVRPAGSITWVMGQAIPEKNAAGKVIGYVGTVTDVTEHRTAEESILREKNLSDTLINNLPGIFYLYDAEGNFIRWNNNFESVTGYSGEEIKNMHPLNFYDDNQKGKIAARIKTVFEKRIPGVEIELLKKDKTTIPFFINSLKINYEGRDCLLGIGLDLTDQRKAEESIRVSNERYNLVAKATNDSIWDLNILTGEITRTGDGFRNLFGYDAADSVQTDPEYSILIHPDDLAAVRISMVAAFQNPGIFYWAEEYRLLKANREYAYVYDKGYIIRDEDGNAVRMIGATQDITSVKENELHLKKLNDDLYEQAKALADSNAELEQFAYVASHDLQEPLRMVTSFLTLLELNYGEHIDDKGRNYIHFAVDGAKRMRQIILDLLEISRVGRSEDSLELLDLNLLVAEILQLLQKQVDENKAVVEVGELPVLYAYRSPIMQVFQNLLGNSVKYIKKGIVPQIKISAEETPGYWQFSIADNGIGIEPEYFGKIFIIFQRLHNQNEFSGTGIGLAISKKIIENLGGRIWLESVPGKGTTFYFTIKK
ncbi:PAS domain S-box protein [Ferruginibacter paludis]|uniref:PAS domain S-box protein n=1 Tax=Ferruginibacter paludis TaxID=1310417 RepID=UPI0025B4DFEE|nr:PAS domain S-box protein [Ferruginibacter paludis]MDN3657001.1 PAS domain S-box protein [Ferruginibacter paludis]